jgi:hypothetical protein
MNPEPVTDPLWNFTLYLPRKLEKISFGLELLIYRYILYQLNLDKLEMTEKDTFFYLGITLQEDYTMTDYWIYH